MNAVILAAGRGSRLGTLTVDRPKTLLSIKGKTLLSRILSSLLNHGITEITLVLGFQPEKIIAEVKENFPQINIRFVFNTEYQKRENIYSLFLALPFVQEGDLLILNADLFFEDGILKKLLQEPENAIVVDHSSVFTEEATKVKLNEEGFVADIGKELLPIESDGESIGMLKLTQCSAILYGEQVTAMVERGDTQVWYPYALKKILPQLCLKPVPTGTFLWEEIDTIPDYERAIQKAEGKSIKQKLLSRQQWIFNPTSPVIK